MFIFSLFLMVFSIAGYFGNVAEAVGDWIKNPEKHESIQGIVIDTRYLIKNYDGQHDYDKFLLVQEIESGIKEEAF